MLLGKCIWIPKLFILLQARVVVFKILVKERKKRHWYQ